MVRHALTALPLLAMPGCSPPPDVAITGRVWITQAPKGPRTPFAAFVLGSVGKGPAAGVFHHGSLYAGAYRAVTFRPTGRGRGKLRELQSGRTSTFTYRPCRPDRGYDRCIEVGGDPFGQTHYQSKDRWRIPGRRAGAADLAGALAHLFARDEASLQP